MADPYTLAATVGTSLLGGIFGSEAQERAQQDQRAFNNGQMAIAREQLEMAREMQKLGLATQIDANGNMTYYDEATNTWRSVLSPTQQRIQDLTDQENIARLEIDAPVSRAEKLTQAIARQRMGGSADMARLENVDAMRHKVDANAIGNVLAYDRQRAVSEGFDKTRSDLATTALRSGASGFGSLAGALAKQKSQQLALTRGSPLIEGIEKAANINNANTQNTNRNYAQFFNQLTSGGFGQPTIGNVNGGDISSALSKATTAGQSAMNGIGGAGQTLGNTILNTADDYTSPWLTAGTNIADALAKYQSNRTRKDSDVKTEKA